MDWLVALLRVVHIAGGMFWFGGALTFFLFVAPSLEALQPPARKAFIDQFVGRRRFGDVILVVATLNILAGALLYWRLSGGLNEFWLRSPSGIGFTVGGVAGIVAWLVAAVAIRPTFDQLGKLGDALIAAGRPPTAEEGARLAALGGRLRLSSQLLLALLATAVIFMSISRYLS